MAKKKQTKPADKYSDKPIQNRVITTAVDIRFNLAEIENAMFQHSVLCQAFLPYRNPGDKVTVWEREEGNASLYIQCLQKKHPETGDFITLGLPYGTRARLILAYLNSRAIITQNRVVDVAETMTSFIKQMGIATTGRNIRDVKNQLARIASSVLSVSYRVPEENRTINADFKLIKAYDLWFPKDERQRVLWSSEIELSPDYFESLMQHAIPLDERALAALSNNAMALDIYAWLAQRLHRVKGVQFITWAALKGQFGEGFGRMADFKRKFRSNLRVVRLVYSEAKIVEIDNEGFELLNSPSPIPKKTFHLLSDSTKSISKK